MKILIIDDDELIRERVIEILTSCSHPEDIFQAASGVSHGIECIATFQPDLVFLDIEMQDGTGFDLLKQLNEYDFQPVFITAHNKYALDAFRFSAIDYVQKPFDPEDLITALARAKESIRSRDITRQLDVLKNAIADLKSVDQKIVLRDNKSLYFIKVNDIFHCEAQGSYTTFFLLDGSKIVVSKPIKEYEHLLEPYGFIRTHHSHIVNTRRIVRLDKSDGGLIILENGHEVPISQRKWDHILELLAVKFG